MNKNSFDLNSIDIAWCPGCGNYSILKIMKQTLVELNISPNELVLVSGIGQAAKIPQYFKTNYFNGLHGRALPPATAIKIANPNLTVIAESGDGDMYGEGGNHFIHAIRRNPNITNVIHNNMVYGLTKGQASPTSEIGFKTPVQINGVILEPFNPISTAIALNASFVARAFSGDIKETINILKKAIKHKGFSIVDILQPCVSFNKFNTFNWFKNNTYYLNDKYDSSNRVEAFKKSIQNKKLPLGIFYINKNRKIFEKNINKYQDNKIPLFKNKLKIDSLSNLIKSKK
jgi:2-oxoglutarate ferredoxin oxidoreductase subunit beta